MMDPNSVYNRDFSKQLDALNRRFDPAENLLAAVGRGRGYHSGAQGRVHNLRDSMDYVLLLLETGAPQDRKRAHAVIARVLSLQDKDPASRSYGVWSYTLEEPLENMLAVDFNWADFIGLILDKVLIDHGDGLPAALAEEMKQALRRSCACIIKRNVGPDYTNINLMGALVTILSGELLADGGIESYGKRRLEKAVRYTRWSGNITEYNSPTYMRLDAELTGEMLHYFHEAETLRMAEELNDFVWKCITEHYHAPTGQWAGPHCRCYSSLVDDAYLPWLEAAADFRVRLPGPKTGDVPFIMGQYPIRCPERYFDCLEAPAQPRWLTETVYRENTMITPDEERTQILDEQTPTLESRTYLTGTYTLGSFVRCDLWAQRSALIAYWGPAGSPSYLRLRCMHDAYDYSSAMLFVSQQRGRAAGAVNFVTDHGDFHFILEPLKDKRIRAKKLALRFEFGGDVGALRIDREGEGRFRVLAGDVCIGINIPYCRLDGNDVPIETGEEGGVRYIEAVFYRGEEKTIDFGAIREAAMAFYLEIADKAEELTTPDEVSCRQENGALEITAGSDGRLCRAQIPVKPLTYLDDLRQAAVL